MGKRVTYLLIGGLIVISLLGCGKGIGLNNKKYTDQSIIPVIEENLKRKYNEEFKVESVNIGDDGTNFSHKYFLADVKCQRTGTSFQLRIEAEGTGLEDNYEGNLYRPEIEENIKEIASSDNLIRFTQMEVEYMFSDGAAGTLEQYKKSGNAILQADASVEAENDEKAVGIIYGFINALQENGYGYSLDVEWNGKHVILYKKGEYDKITQEQIRRKLEG